MEARVTAQGVWRGSELWWIVSDGIEIEQVSDVRLRTVAGAHQEYPWNYIDVVRKRDVVAYWNHRKPKEQP
jgi:hypothetical protein